MTYLFLSGKVHLLELRKTQSIIVVHDMNAVERKFHRYYTLHKVQHVGKSQPCVNHYVVMMNKSIMCCSAQHEFSWRAVR